MSTDIVVEFTEDVRGGDVRCLTEDRGVDVSFSRLCSAFDGGCEPISVVQQSVEGAVNRSLRTFLSPVAMPANYHVDLACGDVCDFEAFANLLSVRQSWPCLRTSP